MIAIKPHHFVDIVTTLGSGQTEFRPHPHGHALHMVAQQILGNPDLLLCIELGTDDICLPCRHNIAGICDDNIDTSFRPEAPKSKREYNLLFDQRWTERLWLRPGDQLTARELCLRIRDSAGDILDIYRESPSDRTAARQAKLQWGVARFLDQSENFSAR